MALASQMMNESLRKELLEMKERDVSTRSMLVDSGELHQDGYHPLMKAVHEENNLRIKQIISEYGWPKESDVGEDGAEAAWLIVQHAVLEPEFQTQCVALLQDAVDRGEAKGWFLAYLHDRVLVRKGEKQVYGTQHDMKDGRVFPFPIENPDKVNELRERLDLWSQEGHTDFLQRDYDTLQRNKLRAEENLANNHMERGNGVSS